MTTDELIEMVLREIPRTTTKTGKWHPCGSRFEKARQRAFARALKPFLEHIWYER
jgi:hypothetical protein